MIFSGSKIVLKLTALAAVCGLLLGTTNLATYSEVERNRVQFAARQLAAVAGNADRVVFLEKDAYLLLKNNEPTGYIFRSETNEGYNGLISFWLGVNNKGEVLGVKVIKHTETPGLGDAIEVDVSDWIHSLAHHRLSDTNFDVKKHHGDFDQFTGATITPRALVRAVGDRLVQFKKEQAELDGVTRSLLESERESQLP